MYKWKDEILNYKPKALFLKNSNLKIMVIPLSLDYLISANLYMGFNSTFRHQSMLYYISNVKFNVDILNLSFTLHNLRVFLSFLKKIYFNKGIVWCNIYLVYVFFKKFFKYNYLFNFFRGISSFFLRKKFKSFKKNRLFFFYFKWDYGLVSNYKRLRKHWKRNDKYKRFKLKFPQTVLFLSKVNINTHSVPYMHVVDTSLDIAKSFYLVNANNKSFKSTLFFLRIIVKDLIISKRLQKLVFRKGVLLNVFSRKKNIFRFLSPKLLNKRKLKKISRSTYSLLKKYYRVFKKVKFKHRRFLRVIYKYRYLRVYKKNLFLTLFFNKGKLIPKRKTVRMFYMKFYKRIKRRKRGKKLWKVRLRLYFKKKYRVYKRPINWSKLTLSDKQIKQKEYKFFLKRVKNRNKLIARLLKKGITPILQPIYNPYDDEGNLKNKEKENVLKLKKNKLKKKKAKKVKTKKVCLLLIRDIDIKGRVNIIKKKKFIIKKIKIKKKKAKKLFIKKKRIIMLKVIERKKKKNARKIKKKKERES